MFLQNGWRHKPSKKKSVIVVRGSEVYMLNLETITIELRSRLDKIAYHIEQLSSSEKLSDETYIMLLDVLHRTIKQQFEYLNSLGDSLHIPVFAWMLRFDLRTPFSNLKTAANYICEKYDSLLSLEQRELARAIENIAEELIVYINNLDDV